MTKHYSFWRRCLLRRLVRSLGARPGFAMEEPTAEVRRKAPPCGNPRCTSPEKDVRLQLIPEGFVGTVRPGATCFHRKRADCCRHFMGGEPGKPGRPSKRVCARCAQMLCCLGAENSLQSIRARQSLVRSTSSGAFGVCPALALRMCHRLNACAAPLSTGTATFPKCRASTGAIICRVQ